MKSSKTNNLTVINGENESSVVFVQWYKFDQELGNRKEVGQIKRRPQAFGLWDLITYQNFQEGMSKILYN